MKDLAWMYSIREMSWSPKKVKDHSIVITLCAEPTDEGDAHTSGKGLVDTSFIFELGMLGLDALQFDGNLLARNDVGT